MSICLHALLGIPSFYFIFVWFGFVLFIPWGSRNCGGYLRELKYACKVIVKKISSFWVCTWNPRWELWFVQFICQGQADSRNNEYNNFTLSVPTIMSEGLRTMIVIWVEYHGFQVWASIPKWKWWVKKMLGRQIQPIIFYRELIGWILSQFWKHEFTFKTVMKRYQFQYA